MTSSRIHALALCGTVVCITVTGVAAMSLPAADHLGPGAKRAANVTRELLPEGWSFFTKSPRDSFVVAYDEAGEEMGTGANMQLKWAFGLNRASRLGGIDVDRVMEQLDRAAWRGCKVGTSVSECVNGLNSRHVRIKNDVHSLCGEITLVRKRPTPWAFRGTDSRAEEVAAVKVRCT